MPKPKIEELEETLVKKSINRQIEWKQDSNDTYTFSTQSASVSVSQNFDYDTEQRYTSIYVYDKKGNLIDHDAVVSDFRVADTTELENLFTEARRIALGSDGVIDIMLTEIKEELDDI